MKTCTKCGETKPPDEFYLDRSKADDRRSRCKSCVNNYNATRCPEYIREHSAKYKASRKGKAAARRYNKTEAGKACMARANKRWDANNPHKRVAHRILYRAVMAGKITRPASCSSCGAGGRIHGHHDDYEKPLEVIWVCATCHIAIHREELIC